MADFNIWYKDDETHSDSFFLGFSGIDGTRLIMKNMKFLQKQSDTVDSAIPLTHTIYIRENGVCHSFQYPKPNIKYKEVKFEIKQSGSNGWIVNVDLNTHEVDIQESPYQIL